MARPMALRPASTATTITLPIHVLPTATMARNGSTAESSSALAPGSVAATATVVMVTVVGTATAGHITGTATVGVIVKVAGTAARVTTGVAETSMEVKASAATVAVDSTVVDKASTAATVDSMADSTVDVGNAP
jgi:hypothetical protein